jgi:hypothetical protein
MKTLDVLILILALPALAVLVTVWLPWERWIPWARLPRLILGPYVLYVAFVAWHFRLPGWLAASLFLLGLGIIVIGIVERVKKRGDS